MRDEVDRLRPDTEIYLFAGASQLFVRRYETNLAPSLLQRLIRPSTSRRARRVAV